MSTTSRRRRERLGAPTHSRHRSLVHPITIALGVTLGLILGVFWYTGLATESEALPLGTANVKGLASAPVEIENWSDFQCPACKAFAGGTERQIAETAVVNGQVRIVFRHMAFLGEESVQAAAASECAAEQGQFWGYHDRLFAASRGRNSGTFSKQFLTQTGEGLVADTARFNSCVNNEQGVARVLAERQMGEQKGVQRTPTLFVNGQKIEGAPSLEQLQKIIEQVAMLVPAPGNRGS